VRQPSSHRRRPSQGVGLGSPRGSPDLQTSATPRTVACSVGTVVWTPGICFVSVVNSIPNGVALWSSILGTLWCRSSAIARNTSVVLLGRVMPRALTAHQPGGSWPVAQVRSAFLLSIGRRSAGWTRVCPPSRRACGDSLHSPSSRWRSPLL
jgi:hypothetical protein